MIGLDTSALIDLFKGDDAVKGVIMKHDEVMASTQISYFELMIGLDPDNSRHVLEENYIDRAFQQITRLGVDDSACKKSSSIYWELRKKGEMIDKFDCLIGGIFLSKGVSKVITRNVKHFKKIRGLKVISY